jgi:hypothetical protein
MKLIVFAIVCALAFAAPSAEAKRAWNGPDLHGINPEAAGEVTPAAQQ